MIDRWEKVASGVMFDMHLVTWNVRKFTLLRGSIDAETCFDQVVIDWWKRRRRCLPRELGTLTTTLLQVIG